MSPHRRTISAILLNSNPKSARITLTRSFGRVFYALCYGQFLAGYRADAAVRLNSATIDTRQGLVPAGVLIMADLA